MQKVLLFGYGSMGRRYATTLRDLGYEVHVCTQQSAEFHTVDFEAADRHEYAFTVIARRPRQQVQAIEYAVSRRLPFLVEKPIAGSDAGLDTVERHLEGLVCGVVFPFRRHLCLLELRRLLEAKDIGEVYGFNCMMGSYLPDWRPNIAYELSASAELGVDLDMVHEFDYLRFLFGDVVSLKASCCQRSHLKTPVDWVDAILEFDNGVQGGLHLDYLQRFNQRLTQVVCASGTYELNLETNTLYLLQGRERTVLLCDDRPRWELIQEVLENFIAALEQPPSIESWREGRESLKLALACREGFLG